MSLSNGFDVRASSLVGDIDAAIERVVAHFEDNDIALRVDVLRALAAQAKLSFETERMKERLRQHPITRDLIDTVTTRSTVYERLATGLAVQEFSSEYDAQRNVEILATVQWLLKEDDAAQKKSKKRKTQNAAKKADRSVPLILRYAYSRSLTDETTTLVEFRVTSCVDNVGKPKELVHFAMSSSAPYPRSFYEDVNDGGLSDDDDEEEDVEEAKKADGKEEKEEDDASEDEQQDGSDQEAEETADGEAEGDDQEGSEAGSEQPEGPFGEAVEAFAFDESAVEDILAWLGEEDNVDPADVMGFFLALPVYEDEWQLDERVTEIVFNGQSGDDGDGEEEEEEDWE